MNATVEAKSLSSLTALAFNPPQYPRNPTHEKHEPLTLYIARVPGSRDVFLTPMKPRHKVVTAEDIQSSLYYFHFDRPEDELLITSSSDQDEAEEHGTPDLGFVPPTPVHRKALPSLPPLTKDSGGASDRRSFPSMSPMTPVSLNPPHPSVAAYSLIAHVSPLDLPKLPIRKPVAPPVLSGREDVANRHNISAAAVARRPVGARPMSQLRGLSDVGPIRGRENTDPNYDKRAHAPWDVSMRSPLTSEGYAGSQAGSEVDGTGNTTMPSGLSSTMSSYDFGDHVEARERHPSSSFCRRAQSSPKRRLHENLSDSGESITIIRRDPTSGAQWNVGTIKDSSVLEVSSEAQKGNARISRQTGAPMYIEINNPGYSKFLSPAEPRPPFDSMNSRSSMDTGNAFENTWSGDLSHEADIKDRHFKRRLWYEGSRLSGRSFGHRKTSSAESQSGVEASRHSLDILSLTGRDRGTDDPEPLSLVPGSQRIAAIPGTGKRSSAVKGYTFMSPWNGRCEFSTGLSGKSLFCKHSLPVANSTVGPSPPVLVSELRFNLPVSVTPSVPSTPATDQPLSRKSYFFARPLARRGMSSSSDTKDSAYDAGSAADRSDKLDLSLGQEDAGGGFGGKQAKLGKLIIQDEGIKMLDLLVAANMSLWWRAYARAENVSHHSRGNSQDV